MDGNRTLEKGKRQRLDLLVLYKEGRKNSLIVRRGGENDRLINSLIHLLHSDQLNLLLVSFLSVEMFY